MQTMCRFRPIIRLLLAAAFISTTATVVAAFGWPPPVTKTQDDTGSAANKPEYASEKEIIAALEEMRDAPGAEYTPADLHGAGVDHKKKIIETVDELLRRYPKTTWRDEALILQMQTLAHLSRVKPEHLGRFHAVTDKVQKSKPTGALAVEGAYYSIQAFVMAARAEKMPQERRWLGALERYQAFVEDFPDSEYAPIMWASLIRNAVKLGRLEEARSQLKKMQAKFPQHPATARAIGEVGRTNAVGRPFVIKMRTREGDPAGTADYYGKVLIVHFWASWGKKSVDELPDLMKLYDKHKDEGLALLGVNADRTTRAFMSVLKVHDLPWQQYYDGKGMKNDIVVMLGITELPNYYVVDRQGYLRAINPEEGLAEFVAKLLKEPVKPIKFNDPNAETPKAETSKAETSKAETPKAETSKTDKQKTEKPKAEKPKRDKSESDTPPPA